MVQDNGNGIYKVSQKYVFDDGKMKPVGSDAEEYRIAIVSEYKAGSSEPVDVIRYSNNSYGNVSLVVQRTIKADDGSVTHYLLDHSKNGINIEYSGYDYTGKKVQGKEQAVRIIDKDNNVLAEYKGEDIENALLAPSPYSTDNFYNRIQSLLDVDYALSYSQRGGVSLNPEGYSNFIEHINAAVSRGDCFKPEGFIKQVPLKQMQHYVAPLTPTPIFGSFLHEYNYYAKSRNLRISETVNKNGEHVLSFTDNNKNVVREVVASPDGELILKDTFNQLNSDGEIVQSATKNGDGEIISRTFNEFRQHWGKASTITLDYKNGTAHSGLYQNGKLTNTQTHDLKTGIALFRIIADR